VGSADGLLLLNDLKAVFVLPVPAGLSGVGLVDSGIEFELSVFGVVLIFYKFHGTQFLYSQRFVHLHSADEILLFLWVAVLLLSFDLLQAFAGELLNNLPFSGVVHQFQV
jgi:hypothetical protein